MSGDHLCSAREAARRLGISTTCLYDWLGQSDRGVLVLRGKPITVDYFQTGRQGQGRIQIEVREIERIREALRVRPQPLVQRRLPTVQSQWPGIHVPLGRPDQR